MIVVLYDYQKSKSNLYQNFYQRGNLKKVVKKRLQEYNSEQWMSRKTKHYDRLIHQISYT